ncbi:hypothetical protein KVF89_18595 [Nocardioides carbamazepini]|uniref:hypothetical protein n=1 Tax=Nocardioides carbamazepini TaxID=2854259 RepID=UPI00214A79AA|nr:hypothetical protein [Nocardioides carbamazepini]MCR1784559.1 hypothetical protein [Nocardioides carbamazepini]
MKHTIRRRRSARTLLAATGTVALVALTATSAHAGTPSTSNGTATLTANHANLSTNSGYTVVSGTSPVSGVAVSGTGYSGNAGATGTGAGVGVYVVYGPKESDFNTNSGWYNSFAYVPKASMPGGTWSGVSLDLEETYTADPFHDDIGLTVDCGFDWTKDESDPANSGKKKCYIQTFTAHGQPLNPNDELAIEVRW